MKAAHAAPPSQNAHLFGQLAAAAQADPSACALSGKAGTCLSYGELHDAALYLAGYLQQRLAVRAGSRVALVMDACHALPVAYYAILRCDAVVVPMSTAPAAGALADGMLACRTRVAIAAHAHRDAVPALLAAGVLRSAVIGAPGCVAGLSGAAPTGAEAGGIHMLDGALAAGIAPLRMGQGGTSAAVIAAVPDTVAPATRGFALLSHHALAAMTDQAASVGRSPLAHLLTVQRAVSQRACLHVLGGTAPWFDVLPA
ncbi:hypothetical protein CNECB9_4640013 [Cupriavidus necator]|uniref:AMP-dependent synthetase/ligase domain-containing protein n=1 Tax=Cupriavidus necator TaxID=106590 RepID=A0A1K0IYY0_CUPNE|nr:hypothetical protein CNECB9_4640013 [Cupriavidus necator]